MIDKDHASALLAAEIGADALLILTDVDAVYTGWGTPDQRAVGDVTPDMLDADAFAAGSMGPKVRAACWFAERGGGYRGNRVDRTHTGAVAGRDRDPDRHYDRRPHGLRERIEMATTALPPTAAEVPTWHVLSREGAVHELHVEPEQGLTSAEAAERLARYGPNKFAEAKTEPRWKAFLRQYQDPMQIVLLAAGVISIYPVKQPGTGIMILLLTLLNAVLGLSQEGKAAAAVAALAKMMIIKARVRRDGKLAQLPAEQLVPGDVVEIEAGDLVPADGRLLSTATLEIAEAALTGESLPVGKGVETVDAPDAALGDRTDMVYMNTNVTRGTGSFVVTSTGMETEVGHISGMLQHQDESDVAADAAAREADQAARADRRARARHVGGAQHGARPELHRGVHRRRRLRRSRRSRPAFRRS